MRQLKILLSAFSVTAFWAASLQGAETTAPGATPVKPGVVKDAYPGLASGALMCAKLADLPGGTLVKSEGLSLAEKDVSEKIAGAPKEMQEQLKKNAFFLLENIAAEKLLLVAARAQASKAGKDVSSAGDREVIQGYLKGFADDIKATEKEVAEFYESNKDMCGGASLDQIKPQLEQYVRQQKQQEAINKHVETLGERIPVQVSAAWVRQQAALARDNPVDKARQSGKPTMVDFGADGCRPCEMMAPILKDLEKKYAGKANVLFVQVRQEQILGARYGIRSIPVQVFFDKDGQEVFRHTGFYPQEEIEKRLTSLGVK